jgi:hypothetical protein
LLCGFVESWEINKTPGIFGADKSNGGYRRRVYYSNASPTIEISNKITISSSKIHILAPSFREHSSQFGKGHSSKKRNDSSDNPDNYQQIWRTKLTSHGCRLHKNTRPDHAADYNCDSRPKPNRLLKLCHQEFKNSASSL